MLGLHIMADVLSSFARTSDAVMRTTGNQLSREIYAEFQHVSDPDTRFSLMCNAATAAAEHDWELQIENQIDSYLEACSPPDGVEEDKPVVVSPIRRRKRGAR